MLHANFWPAQKLKCKKYVLVLWEVMLWTIFCAVGVKSSPRGCQATSRCSMCPKCWCRSSSVKLSNLLELKILKLNVFYHLMSLHVEQLYLPQALNGPFWWITAFISFSWAHKQLVSRVNLVSASSALLLILSLSQSVCKKDNRRTTLLIHQTHKSDLAVTNLPRSKWQLYCLL